MKDEDKSKKQPINELVALRQRVAELEALKTERNRGVARSEARYRQLVENPLVGFWQADTEGRFTYINKQLAQMSGYAPDEVIGMSMMDPIAPELRPWLAERMRKRKENKLPPAVVEAEMVRKDGSRYSALVAPSTLFDDQGKFSGFFGLMIDITERKRAEEALRESEEKYRSLFENANDAIFIANTKTGIILDANRKAEQLTGRTREEIIGMHQSELHPPQRAHYYKEKFRTHVQNGSVLDLEAEVIEKNGRIVPVIICASVISLHGKEVTQGLFRDISEEKMILELREEIAARKLIEKAKGILMDRHKISEKEAV
ncbi:MAG: PAS domain S-box protein, partial [Deltaproteobacteria bacterium]